MSGDAILDSDELEAIIKIAIDGRLFQQHLREFLMHGLPPGLWADLPIKPTALSQLRGDLATLNALPEATSVNGPPLALWLENAARQFEASHRPGGHELWKWADRVRERVKSAQQSQDDVFTPSSAAKRSSVIPDIFAATEPAESIYASAKDPLRVPMFDYAEAQFAPLPDGDSPDTWPQFRIPAENVSDPSRTAENLTDASHQGALNVPLAGQPSASDHSAHSPYRRRLVSIMLILVTTAWLLIDKGPGAVGCNDIGPPPPLDGSVATQTADTAAAPILDGALDIALPDAQPRDTGLESTLDPTVVLARIKSRARRALAACECSRAAKALEDWKRHPMASVRETNQMATEILHRCEMRDGPCYGLH